MRHFTRELGAPQAKKEATREVFERGGQTTKIESTFFCSVDLRAAGLLGIAEITQHSFRRIGVEVIVIIFFFSWFQNRVIFVK